MSGEEQLGETIKIYKDSSIVSLELVAADDKGNSGQFLMYTYLKADGSEDVVYVNVSDFLTQSEFGNGLIVSEAGVVSVLKDTASESYLTISNNGIKVSGIDAIKSTADSAIQDIEGEYLYKNNKSINIYVCSDLTEESLSDDSYRVADAYAVKDYVDNAVAPLAKDANVVKTVSIATDCADFATAVKTNNNVEFTFYYGGDDAE